jgi:hypothetical protein
MGLFGWGKKQAGRLLPNEGQIRASNWMVRDNEVIREYIYGDDHVRFQVHCTLTVGFMGHIGRHVNFMLQPILVAGEGFVVGQLALQGKRTDAPFFTMRSAEVPGNANLFGIAERESSEGAVSLLLEGRDLQFSLLGDDKLLLELPVPNDSSFTAAYRSVFDRLDRG